MTSIHGTDTAYDAMADDFLALAPSCTDNIFGTGSGITKGNAINYCDLVQSMRITDGQENNFSILQDYQNKRQQCKSDLLSKQLQKQQIDNDMGYLYSSNRERTTNVMDIIQKFKDISLFNDLLSYTSWNIYLRESTNVTVFVPLNSWINRAQQTWLKNKSMTRIKDVLKSHTCNFVLNTSRMINKRLEVYSMYEPFSFVVDGTGETMETINVYQRSNVLLDNQYPNPYNRFSIVKAFETDNGNVFIIDGMFNPEII